MALDLANDLPTVIALGVAALGAIGTAVKMCWGWMTNLVEKFQADAVSARQEFAKEVGDSRREFTAALKDIEGARQASEQRFTQAIADVHESLVGLHEIIRERGVPAPILPPGAAHAS